VVADGVGAVFMVGIIADGMVGWMFKLMILKGKKRVIEPLTSRRIPPCH
jgi:hypothetical protein